jgi:hypothetical protein
MAALTGGGEKRQRKRDSWSFAETVQHAATNG